MSNLESLERLHKTLDAELTNLTVQVREARKRFKKAATYAEELRLRVILTKAEYDLAMSRGKIHDVLGQIAQAKGEWTSWSPVFPS